MPDASQVSARMTVDIADFKAGMDAAATSAKASLDQISSQLSAIRGASNQTSQSSVQMAGEIKQALESIASMAEKSVSRYTATQRLSALEERRRTEEAKTAATTIAAQASVVVAGIAQEMEATKQVTQVYRNWAQVSTQLSRQSTAQTLASSQAQVSANQAQIANYRMLGQQAAAASSQIVSANNAQAASARAAAQQAASAAQVQVAALNQQTQAIRLQIAQLQQSGQANQNHANSVGVNSTAIREFLVIMREAARGDTTRMAGSLSILAQQFEFTRNILASLISPMGAVIALMGFIGYEAFKGFQEQRDFANALELSGNKADLTEASFNKLSETLSGKTNTSILKTKEVLSTIATSGEFTRKTTELMAQAALDFGHKSGIGIDEALKKFMEADRGVAKSAYELNRNYAILSVAEAKRIKNLEDMGEKDKAEAELMQAVIKKTKTMNENLGYLETGWRELTKAISAATSALMNWGKTPTKTDRLDGLKAEAAQIKSNIEMVKKTGQTQFGNKEGLTKEYERLAQIEAKIKSLTGEIAGDEAKATKEAKDRAATQKQVGDILKPPKEKKEHGAATQSQIVRGELLDYLNEHEQAAIDMHKIYTNRLQDTLTFYTEEAKIISKRKGATEADVTRVNNQVKAAKLAVDRERQSAGIVAMQDEIKDESKGYQERIRLAREFEAKLKNDLAKPDNPEKGEFNQPPQFYAAHKARLDEERRGLEESLKIQQEEYKGFATIELEKLDDLKSSYKIQLTEHQINLKAYLALMRQAAADELKIKDKLIDDEIELEKKKSGGGDLVKLKQLDNQKLLLDSQTNKALIKNSQEAAKDYMKPWDDAWKHMGNSFASQIEKVIKGQHNLGQAFRYTIGDMVLYGAKEMEMWAFKQLKFYAMDLLGMNKVETAKTVSLGIHTQARVGVQAAGSAEGVGIKAAELPVHFGIETAKNGATAVGEETRVGLQAAGSAEGLAIKAAAAISQIAMDAWTAMAGAYAAIAAIPYVGPVLAPIAAGVAFAGVIAIANNIASAEGGYDIPKGVNPVTQLHEEEMVLPKQQANVIRNMATGGNMGIKQTGGDTHIHMNITTPDADSFRKSSTQIQRETRRKMSMRIS